MPLPVPSPTSSTRQRLARASIAGALLLGASLSVTPGVAEAADTTFVVDTTADDPDAALDGTCATATSQCSLRAALTEANAVAGAVDIHFAIAGSGVKTINLTSQLPPVDNGAFGITIDGFTQPGSSVNNDTLADNAVRNIMLVGQGSDSFDGLDIDGSNNVVRGLTLISFHRAIALEGSAADRNEIVGNSLGLTASGAPGDRDFLAGANCVDIRGGARRNVIGKPGLDNRNIISSCPDKSVSMFDSFTFGNKVQNNIIGLDKTGTLRRGSFIGVDINREANGNTVGGLGSQERNVISGHMSSGVEISHDAGTINNKVIGNFIGTTLDGKNANTVTRNNEYGIRLEGRTDCMNGPCELDLSRATVTDNIVVNSGFGGILVDKGAHDSVIANNKIGVTLSGKIVGNGSYGITIASGSQDITVGPGNVIAGSLTGVQITPLSVAPAGGVKSNTSFNTITQNSITDMNGLGIDLVPFGEANQASTADPLVNEGVLAPTLKVDGSNVRANTCASCTVELFESNRSPGQYGSGVEYIATVVANGSGVAYFAPPTGGWPSAVTATTTTTNGSTSEFSLTIDPDSPVVPPAPPTPRSLISIVPARLLETRSGPDDKTIDGEFEGAGRRFAGTTIELQVAGRGGVPADAVAAYLNVTAVVPDGPGFVTVYPCGSPLPLTSNVNYLPGQVEPNAVFTKIGDGGKVCLYTLATTDLIADVSGYAPAGSTLGTIDPARLLETRTGPDDKTIDGDFEGTGRQAAGTTVELQVAGRAGVPADAVAAFLNVTAILPDAPGFVTVFPCGSPLPLTSNVNYAPGQIEPNAVFTKIGDGGKVCLYTLATTDMIVDVGGFAPVGSTLGTLVPTRLLETRKGPDDKTIDNRYQAIGRQGAESTLELLVAGRGGVPADAEAVFLNVTAILPDAPGFITVYPCGSPLPLASNVNYAPGQVEPNAVFTKIGVDGKVCLYTLATTDMIVDVGGYSTRTS